MEKPGLNLDEVPDVDGPIKADAAGVGGDAVGYFEFQPEETLSCTLYEWLDNRERLESYRELGRRRAQEKYRWDAVVDAYERLFGTIVGWP